MSQVQATVAQRDFTFERSEVERLVDEVLPDPIEEHFVTIGGRRFPPKQVISLVTGLDRADFNTHQARRILSRLGFTVGRRDRGSTKRQDRPGGSGPHGGREAELLRPFAGQWVAQKGLEVLVAAVSPEAVLRWLERHNKQADAMFRVPRDESEATGVGPL